jgi:hypothetical protein
MLSRFHHLLNQTKLEGDFQWHALTNILKKKDPIFSGSPVHVLRQQLLPPGRFWLNGGLLSFLRPGSTAVGIALLQLARLTIG